MPTFGKQNICICMYLENEIKIYSFLPKKKIITNIFVLIFAKKKVNPNMYIMVLVPENCICHSLFYQSTWKLPTLSHSLKVKSLHPSVQSPAGPGGTASVAAAALRPALERAAGPKASRSSSSTILSLVNLPYWL